MEESKPKFNSSIVRILAIVIIVEPILIPLLKISKENIKVIPLCLIELINFLIYFFYIYKEK